MSTNREIGRLRSRGSLFFPGVTRALASRSRDRFTGCYSTFAGFHDTPDALVTYDDGRSIEHRRRYALHS
jgi:hypothetical protein